ncbi:MAG: PDZ domain-containing protein [Phycicoccus sp.]|nr:PDZ domain-containing protein [Phycicoccus sp.]NMM33844.1 PDZ domain-containing protein [Phycicoccus sp.]
MTQQPPPSPQLPQTPQPPEGAAEPTDAPALTDAPELTAALWYDQTLPQPPFSSFHGADEEPQVDPQTPAEPRPAVFTQPGVEPAQPAKPRRLAELVTVAVLAAALASTGTYAITRVDETASPAAQTGTRATTTAAAPVVQADASAPNWSVTAAAVSPSVVAISVTSGQSGGQGSGVIFDTQGHILTNNHVVAAGGQNSTITVTLNDKRTYDATVVGTDPTTDLAVIKLTNAPGDLKAIALGDAKALTVGEPVMAVGNPLGLAGTVTTGIVSALNRPVTTSDQQQSSSEPVVTNAIQTSAAINPGNSGGALVNASGQLIGINSAIASLGSSGGSSQSGNIGIGFAIPVNEARSIAEQLITTGKATHPYLGVSSKDGVVPDGSAKRAAAVLTNIFSGTPADKAGLRAGDAIIAVDGNSIDGSLSLVAQIRERSVGDRVTLKILRDGQSKDIDVTLIIKPATNQ